MTFGDGDISLVHYRHLASLLAPAQRPSLSQSLRCFVCSLGWCCPGETRRTARLVMEFEKEIKILSLIHRSWWICGGKWEEIRGPLSFILLTMGIVKDVEDAVKTAELLDILDGWSLELYLLSHSNAKVGPLWNEDSVLGSG